jgi:hypothetical protein
VTDGDDSGFPVNARIETLTFDDRANALLVTLKGDDAARQVPASSVKGLFGGRISHASVTTISGGGGGISFGKIAMTAATGIPMGITKGGPKEKAVVGQDLHHALALRVAGLADVWYLLAASFNFRKALGPETTYSSEMNLRLFVKRLAAFAPEAARDAYFTAIVAGTDLPGPLDSLLEFLRRAAV